MRKLAIFGLFEYIQYGHKVKIIDSNVVANTGAQKNGQTAVFWINFGVVLGAGQGRRQWGPRFASLPSSCRSARSLSMVGTMKHRTGQSETHCYKLAL